jgi:hypothetical protein
MCDDVTRDQFTIFSMWKTIIIWGSSVHVCEKWFIRMTAIVF